MDISLLAHHPDAIDVLAPAAVDYWKQYVEGESVEKRRKKYQSHLNTETLPIAWVAHDGDEYFGTAALRVTDLADRPDITPWLGGVFVRPEYRGRGIASALCDVVTQCAARCEIRQLYLVTLDRQTLYARMGWRPYEAVRWLGKAADIMVRPLAKAHLAF